MGYIRQSFYGIKTYKQKTLLLIAINILFSSIFLCSVSMGNTLRGLESRLGGMVEGAVLIQNRKEERAVIDNQVIPQSLADGLKGLPQVKDYEEIYRAGVQSLDFMDFLEVSEMGYSDDSGNITLIYETNMLENRIFREEKNTVIDGRGIEPGETGYKAVVGRALAEQNHLKVGDRIHMTTHLGREMELEIVGISSSAFNNERYIPTRRASYNHIFTTRDVICEANGTDNLNSIEITLKDCAEAAGFMEGAKKLNTSGAPVSIIPKLDQYHQAVSSAISMENIVNIVAALCFGMGFLVSALFVSYTLLDRYREIGILISMGLGRGRILLQYSLETLFALILSDLAAIAVVGAAGEFLSGYLTGRMNMAQDVRLSLGAGEMALLLGGSLLMTTGIAAVLVFKVTLYRPKELLSERG